MVMAQGSKIIKLKKGRTGNFPTKSLNIFIKNVKKMLSFEEFPAVSKDFFFRHEVYNRAIF
jgi:hypothetical protein